MPPAQRPPRLGSSRTRGPRRSPRAGTRAPGTRGSRRRPVPLPFVEPSARGRRSSPIVGRLPVRIGCHRPRSFSGALRWRGTLRPRCASHPLPAPWPALWPSPRPARGARRDAVPRLTRGGPRGGTALDPPDRHGRPAMGHALVDAGGPALTRRARRHVLGVVHDELALLPEPCVDPHRPVPAHHGRVPAGPPVRRLQVLRRHDDDRHRAPVRWVPHRLLREVPRLLPIRRARRATSHRDGTAGSRSCTPSTSSTGSRSMAPCTATGSMPRTTRPTSSPMRRRPSSAGATVRCSRSTPLRRRTTRRSPPPKTKGSSRTSLPGGLRPSTSRTSRTSRRTCRR